MRSAVVIGGPHNGKVIEMSGTRVQFPFIDHDGFYYVHVPWTILGQDRYACFWEDGDNLERAAR